MKSILSLLILYLSVFSICLGQVETDPQPTSVGFADFKKENPHLFISKEEIQEKAIQRNIPIYIHLNDGVIGKLEFFDVLDQPVYYQVFNLKAAATTRTNSLQPGGDLDVNLTGKGMTVGIYDQTRPKPNHVEFNGRLTQVDGSTEDISSHATHVTGTILASGVNANAKGMASEANGWAFNWESDLSKMDINAYDPENKPNGHIVSNHSYGVVLGWYMNSSGSWVWAGNPSVDENEDYRFGFYSSKSKGIDEVAIDKPYYTIVWAAGNDRNDTGDGTKNPDGPDDTIGPEGVAKNVITVGAVNNIPDYQGANSVSIASFSSWGPTDDGRIKPDIVGMGVGVFSSSVTDEGATDSYASLSGTSMASPNVSGSLVLLQQLYNERNNGRYMRSSTLKGLIINTSREAGTNPGPDYIYGWGLLDTKSAAEIILNENGASNIIREESLSQGAQYEFEIISDGVTPIKATIAWIDPAGTPASPSLNPTNLMLVNDLDFRIIDESGKVYFPWTLDPTKGPNARAEQTQDNFRDNVEQIQILNPTAQKYKLVISHKGDLKDGGQEFSLILKAGVQDGAGETLYWVGGESGSWNSGSNWSLTPGGSAAGKIPSSTTRVVFDGAGSPEVAFSSDANAFSVNLFGDQTVSFDLGGNDLKVSNGFRVSNQITQISNGRILFDNSSSNEQLLEFGQTTFEDLTLLFQAGDWKLLSGELLGDVSIQNANLEVGFQDLSVNSLVISANGGLTGSYESMSFQTIFNAQSGSSLQGDFDLTFDGNTGQFNNQSGSSIRSLKVTSGKLTVQSGGIGSLSITNAELIQSAAAISVNDLILGASSVLNLGATGKLTVNQSINSSATASNPAQILAISKGEIIHPVYKKYCFENISVTNVDLKGDAIVNLGTGARLTNSSGWLNQDCDDVLFANFDVAFSCVGAAVDFENLSEGAITSYSWDFAGLGTSTLENPFFVFESTGTYEVELTVTNSGGSTSFTQEVVISESALLQPVIVVNGTTLTSQQPGESYQWYLNGEKLNGVTTRSYSATNDGTYQVAIFSEGCNRISEPVVISAIPDQEVELSRFGIFVGPIPSDDQINITVNNEYLGPIEFSVLDLSGKVINVFEVGKNSESLEVKMGLPINRGLYILRIKTNNLTLHKKVIKR